MNEIKDKLVQLRALRREASIHYAKAADYFERASRGMSTRRATSIGGTGGCPLTDYAPAYMAEKEHGREISHKANELVRDLMPVIRGLPAEQQQIVLLYYDRLLPWVDIAKAAHRSREACWRMHRQAIAALSDNGE